MGVRLPPWAPTTPPQKEKQMTYKTYEVKVYDNGSKYWYQHGKRHREDGPAREFSDGSKFWYQHGKRHREDGPACEYANGTKHWYLDNKKLTEQEFNQRMSSCDGKVVEIEDKKYKLQEI